MRHSLVALVVASAMAVGPQPIAARWQTAPADLATGISQIHEGDFDAAVLTLDGVVKQLLREGGAAPTVARVHAYLAIAYVGLGQDTKARAALLEGWKADHRWNPSPTEFPPLIVDLFDDVRTEAETEASGAPGHPSPDPVITQPSAAVPGPPNGSSRPGHRSRIPLIILGAGAAGAGVAVAVASNPESSPPVSHSEPTPTPTPPPATPKTETFSGLLTAADLGPYHDNYHVIAVGAAGTLEATMFVSVSRAPNNEPSDVGIYLWLYSGRRDYSNGTGGDTVARDRTVGSPPDTFNQTYHLTAAVTPGTYTLRAWCNRIGAVYASYTLQVSHP